MNTTKWLAAGAGIATASYGAYVAQAWLRYGRPRPARDELLDAVMPSCDVSEHHQIEIDAPADVTLAAAKDQDLQASRIIRAIFRARELILRARPEPREPKGIYAELLSLGWGVVAEAPGREVVLGAVTRPWEANVVFHPVPAEEFARFAESGYVKIAVTLRAEPRSDGGSTFYTETRAVATSPDARRKFRRYWALLSAGIILIRRAMLPALAAAVDRRWQLEGDDVYPDARAQLTHAVAIDAPASDVWPWLVQMGCQRGGWYSWDVIDNGGKRSAEHIISDLQHLAPGDVLPFKPEGTEGFEVVRVIPERALVLRSVGPQWSGTWAFVLEPLAGGRTRLITRYRASYPASTAMALRLPMMAAVHAFMERKQLRTIKHHAEHMHA